MSTKYPSALAIASMPTLVSKAPITALVLIAATPTLALAVIVLALVLIATIPTPLHSIGLLSLATAVIFFNSNLLSSYLAIYPPHTSSRLCY